MANDYSKCEAFTRFRDMLMNIERKYNHFNPNGGLLFRFVKNRESHKNELDEFGLEFIRGGVVAVMVAWEAYVHDLFEEAFNVVTEICMGESESLIHLQQQWPACRTIIQNEIDRQYGQDKTKVGVGAYELLEEAEKTGKEAWRRMLDDHSERVLREKTLRPIFDVTNGQNSIDQMFRDLFELKSKRGGGADFSLSETLISIGGFKFNVGEHNVILKPAADKAAVQALCNISRLYYGIRCAFVHGRCIKGGVLEDIPEDFPMPEQNHEGVSKNYRDLLERIKTHSRDAHMSFRDFLKISKFFGYAAYFLMLAIAKWFYESDIKAKRAIWGYRLKPQTNEVLTESDTDLGLDQLYGTGPAEARVE